MQYEVTIGIPVYNSEKYLKETLESALSQTFPSIEYLIMDDCSTDTSMAIVQAYQQTHPRGEHIRIVHQPRNMGIGIARNRIIDEAQGQYLYFLDADDIITPDAISLLHENAIQNDAEMVYASHERIEEFDGNHNTTVFQHAKRNFTQENEFANYAYEEYGRLPAPVWNILFRMDVFRKNQLRFADTNFWEDFTFHMDLPSYVTRVSMLPNITYKYICRSGSLSNFQKRTHIDKQEIEKTIAAVEHVKANSYRIADKPYFPQRMCKVMLTCFFMVCHIIQKQEYIEPKFSNSELHSLLKSPVPLSKTLSFRKCWSKNLLLCLLGILPSSASLLLIKLIGGMKGLLSA
jgi:glycosyltransferase involved in cell wall biosynthesis